MSDNQITIKHNKHHIHPCSNDKKLSLLNLLIAKNSSVKIIVATSHNSELIKEAISVDNVTILSDEELIKLPELRCELLISYDLPSTAILYMARLAKATQNALILLDKDEQKQLYPIETLLGRVIKQEIISGFEYKIEEKVKKEHKPFEKPKYDRPKRDGERTERKPFEKPKYDRPKKDGEITERKPFDKPKYDKSKKDGEKSDKFAKTNKKPNKFLGRDENGKGKFSGKSGERNHRYDGKPKEQKEAPKNVGRKIPIKERKPKESGESNS